MVRRSALRATDLAAAAKGRLDRADVAAGLEAAGLPASARTVDALLGEAADLAERAALEKRERRALAALDRPTYELPWLRRGHRPRCAVRAGGRAARPGSGVTAAPPVFAVDAVIDDPSTSIVICCGSGGVGKTTTAAALALRAAEHGRDGRACSPSTRPAGSPSRWG